MTASTVSTIQTTNSTSVSKWKSATWEEYLTYRDCPTPERVRLFFNQGQILIDMGSEGINHSSFSDLFTMLFVLWFSQKPEQTAASFGRCLLEKPNMQAAAPDLVLYIGSSTMASRRTTSHRLELMASS